MFTTDFAVTAVSVTLFAVTAVPVTYFAVTAVPVTIFRGNGSNSYGFRGNDSNSYIRAPVRAKLSIFNLKFGGHSFKYSNRIPKFIEQNEHR